MGKLKGEQDKSTRMSAPVPGTEVPAEPPAKITVLFIGANGVSNCPLKLEEEIDKMESSFWEGNFVADMKGSVTFRHR